MHKSVPSHRKKGYYIRMEYNKSVWYNNSNNFVSSYNGNKVNAPSPLHKKVIINFSVADGLQYMLNRFHFYQR